MQRNLRYYGDPVLRQKSQPVAKVDKNVRQIVDDMKELTNTTGNAIGLAAPQIGVLLRIFVICPPTLQSDGHFEYGKPRVFINPVLSKPSLETDFMEEGCLSLPTIYGKVERPVSITIEAMDEQGCIFKERFEGLAARMVMHENDHINGVLFIDRMKEKDRRAIEGPLRALKKKKS